MHRPASRIKIAKTYTIAMHFFINLTWQANAQDYCALDEPANQLTYLIVNEQNIPIGTAFPIDDRGLFITAKHLIQYNNENSLKITNNRYFHEFEFSVLMSGAYNTTDIFNPYIYDDWAIIKADIGENSIIPFNFRVDDVSSIDTSEVSAHSPIGSHPAQSLMPFTSTTTVPCKANDVMVLSLLDYQKGESGAPISEGRCVYGITSRFDQDYLNFLNGIVDQQQVFQAIQAVVDQLNASEGALRENILEDALEDMQDQDLIDCIAGSEVQCAARHIDDFRELTASLQRVVITPLSCASDSLLRSAFNDTSQNDLMLFSKNPPSEIDLILSTPVLNDRDLIDFSRKISTIRSVREKWSWVSFLQLMEKVRNIDYGSFDNEDGAKKILRNALVLISMEHGMVNLLHQFKDLDVEEMEQQRNIIEQQRAELQARLEELESRQSQVSTTISILNQQTGGADYPEPPPSLEMAVNAREEIIGDISIAKRQMEDLSGNLEKILESSGSLYDVNDSSVIYDASSIGNEDKNIKIADILEESIASEYPTDSYIWERQKSIATPYVSGYISDIDASADPLDRFIKDGNSPMAWGIETEVREGSTLFIDGVTVTAPFDADSSPMPYSPFGSGETDLGGSAGGGFMGGIGP
ncbi:hypothetical protein CP157_03902 (plasmid) [Paracoccus marcusii]|uniref:hypothetical protein n=1 Tax=Paracoccus marcusii TaxID=59779 RepID=UPI001C3C81B4|nr:hypothetical protein [Paracoccus marcusii]QXI66110.1 hypothetical protein CP157_03902 [Paracoccus marcusii]